MMPGERLVLWCDGAHSPAENMRRDGALLAAAADGRLPGTVLRVFQFAPHGITLGLAQEASTELDLTRVERDAIPWAVRPTGGRAIFHAQEWTFSLATRLGDAGWATDARAAYARTCALLEQAMRRLGAPVALAHADHGDLGPRAGEQSAPPCFASTARHELTIGGRKFAGIAQRRQGDSLLQQGSLLLGSGHLRLVDYQRIAPGARDAARVALASASVDAGSHVGSDRRLERFADAIAGAAGLSLERRETGAAGLSWLELE